MIEELKVIISAEIDKFKAGIAQAQDEIDKLADSDSKLNKLNDGFQGVGDAAKGGLKVAAGAVTAITTALLGSASATEEYRTAQAKLVSAFEAAGSSAEVAKGTYNDLYRVLGDGDVAVEAANHLAKLTTNEEELAEWTEICQGVYATFGDSLPIEGLTEAVNHTAKLGEVQGPLADALEWAGINADTFNEQLAACTTESERTALMQQTLSGIYDEAAANYEENAGALLKQNEAQAKMQENLAKIGNTMQPVLTMLTELGATLAEKIAPVVQEFIANHGPKIEEVLMKVAEKVGEVISWIADHWGLVSTIGTIVLAIAAAISVLSTGLGIYTAVMGAASAITLPVIGIIAGVVAGIAALIAIIVIVVKNWDDLKKKTKEVWDSITKWVSEAVDKVKKKFEEMVKNVSTKIDNMKKAVADKFDAIKKSISDKVEAIKKNATEKFETIKKNISDKVEAAKTAVTDKFEAIRSNVNNKVDNLKNNISDKFELIKSNMTSKFEAARTNVLNVFDKIKSGITEKINAARDAVSNAIEKIKGFFNFKFTWPKMPLPHFKISPSGWKIGDLLKGSIPKLSISWYQKGGIFDKPTLFGYGNGLLGGLGENGAEAIVPLEKNTEWLDKIAARLNNNGKSTPIVLQIDGKVFAQTAISTINDLTRQTGTLALNLR